MGSDGGAEVPLPLPWAILPLLPPFACSRGEATGVHSFFPFLNPSLCTAQCSSCGVLGGLLLRYGWRVGSGVFLPKRDSKEFRLDGVNTDFESGTYGYGYIPSVCQKCAHTSSSQSRYWWLYEIRWIKIAGRASSGKLTSVKG